MRIGDTEHVNINIQTVFNVRDRVVPKGKTVATCGSRAELAISKYVRKIMVPGRIRATRATSTNTMFSVRATIMTINRLRTYLVHYSSRGKSARLSSEM